MIQIFEQTSVSPGGCWMLDVGCWMLDVECWMLEMILMFFMFKLKQHLKI